MSALSGSHFRIGNSCLCLLELVSQVLAASVAIKWLYFVDLLWLYQEANCKGINFNVNITSAEAHLIQ